METAIGKTIDQHQADIDAWLKTNPPAGANKSFDGEPRMGNLGTAYRWDPATQTAVQDRAAQHGCRVVLKSDGGGNYVIQTAHPIP